MWCEGTLSCDSVSEIVAAVCDLVHKEKEKGESSLQVYPDASLDKPAIEDVHVAIEPLCAMGFFVIEYSQSVQVFWDTTEKEMKQACGGFTVWRWPNGEIDTKGGLWDDSHDIKLHLPTN